MRRSSQRLTKLVPQPLPRAWKASVTSAKDDFVLDDPCGQANHESGILSRLIPDRSTILRRKNFSHRAPAQRSTLKKSDLLLKPITVLRGVLVIPGGPAYRIEAPVRQPIQ